MIGYCTVITVTVNYKNKLHLKKHLNNFQSIFSTYTLQILKKSIEKIIKNGLYKIWPINLKQSNEDNITNRFGNYDTNWNDCVDQDGGHSGQWNIISCVTYEYCPLD